jgi:hypothetical protein
MLGFAAHYFIADANLRHEFAVLDYCNDHFSDNPQLQTKIDARKIGRAAMIRDSAAASGVAAAIRSFSAAHHPSRVVRSSVSRVFPECVHGVLMEELDSVRRPPPGFVVALLFIWNIVSENNDMHFPVSWLPPVSNRDQARADCGCRVSTDA